ncbi:MAG: S8 family peptidase [Thermoanaerobaculia bacterium]
MIERTELAESVRYRWRTMPGFAARVDTAELERLRADPAVAHVELDYPGKANLVESRALVGADEVRRLAFDGSGITVAVLDTGVDSLHPDLAGRILDEQCFCQNFSSSYFPVDWRGCCPDGTSRQHGTGAAFDRHGHGTSVASVIASSGETGPTGIAPGVNLLSIRVMDDRGRIRSTAQIIAALDWILLNRPDVRVVNMAFGTDATFIGHCDEHAQTFSLMVERLRDVGAIVVAPSGNDANAAGIGLPACLEAAVAVGAVYDADIGAARHAVCTDGTTAPDQVCCFSNSGAALDLLAPGAAITTGLVGGRVGTVVGTSYAAAHVAGAAAILMQLDPSRTVDEIEQILRASGKPVADPRNSAVTTPRLDVFAAVLAAEPPPTRHRPVGRP